MRYANLAAGLTLGCALLVGASAATADELKTVKFPSLDGKVDLVGYVSMPNGSGPFPAVVMMHGRQGPYSTAAKGKYNAKTLSGRHKEWLEFWAEQGYVGILVDGFGPRGYPKGFGKGSYEDRPPELDETTTRPSDSYATLKYLRTRPDIIPGKIGIMGWSNGGSTVITTMAKNAMGYNTVGAQGGYLVGVAAYPGCGLKEKFKAGVDVSAPLHIFAAEDDDEVSPKLCVTLANRSKAKGYPVTVKVYPGAEHSFDAPGESKQSHAPNAEATKDFYQQALTIFTAALKK
ncbi:dienelactone hydrolase family protein [Lacibacterium aquatile]|uniref:Dienelactone hydrolase family protein n=1 Tax=Lacibacterium aquatile TaxID=1168082 RepID=A0ABW5DW02_9PROT